MSESWNAEHVMMLLGVSDGAGLDQKRTHMVSIVARWQYRAIKYDICTCSDVHGQLRGRAARTQVGDVRATT